MQLRLMNVKSAVKYLIFTYLVFALSSFTPSPPANSSVNYKAIEFFLAEYQGDFYPQLQFKELLFVSISKQKLFYIKSGKIVKTYSISTSKYGVGANIYSKKTPTGLHKIYSKIGNGTPVNGVIKSGSFSGEIVSPVMEKKTLPEDYVTTRILRLSGEERGINKGSQVDSFRRAIYIHGTPEEGLIGQPASHGCIRMKNTDVIDLYNRIAPGTYVLILNI